MTGNVTDVNFGYSSRKVTRKASIKLPKASTSFMIWKPCTDHFYSSVKKTEKWLITCIDSQSSTKRRTDPSTSSASYRIHINTFHLISDVHVYLIVTREHFVTLVPTKISRFPLGRIWQFLQGPRKVIDTIEIRPISNIASALDKTRTGIMRSFLRKCFHMTLIGTLGNRVLSAFNNFTVPE
jgi:hypothetical protein